LEEITIEPMFDAILIDEGQDLVAEDDLKYQDKQAIYWLAYQSLRPADSEQPEQKRLIWAYDEAQSLDSLKIPTTSELFGIDTKLNKAVTIKVVLKNRKLFAVAIEHQVKFSHLLMLLAWVCYVQKEC
jgi:superfamily I DNA and RNA helicase